MYYRGGSANSDAPYGIQTIISSNRITNTMATHSQSNSYLNVYQKPKFNYNRKLPVKQFKICAEIFSKLVNTKLILLANIANNR